MDLELIIIFLTCFLSVTTLALLQYWFGEKAEFEGYIVSDFVIGTSTGAKPATASITPADLYFESFGEKYDEEQLEELFVRFGNINSWEMINMRDKTGQGRLDSSATSYTSLLLWSLKNSMAR